MSLPLISRSFGKRILSRDTNYRDLDEFLAEFSKSLEVIPEIEPCLSHLDGLYLMEDTALTKKIRFFPKSLLPFAAKERFHHLFSVRSKWNKTDILPFINELAGSTKEMDALILKHSRVSRVGKQIFLTNRHAVVPE